MGQSPEISRVAVVTFRILVSSAVTQPESALVSLRGRCKDVGYRANWFQEILCSSLSREEIGKPQVRGKGREEERGQASTKREHDQEER